MKLGLAQINTRVGDLPANRRRILEAVEEAASGGAELVVLPRLAVTGCAPADLLLDGAFVQEALATTEAIAAEAARGPALLVGGIEPAGSGPPGHPGLLDAALLLRGGEVVASRGKRLLLSHDVDRDPRWFLPGTAAGPLELAGRKLGLGVGEDLLAEGHALDPAAELGEAGAELLVGLAASSFREGGLAERLRLARRHGLPAVLVNAVGGNDELIFDGGSFALDASGGLRALLPRFEEAVAVVDLFAEGAGLPEPPADGPAQTFAALVLGVCDFARKNGVGRAYLGLSGGIDSSLVACIATEALGPGAVEAVALPSRYTDPRSTEAARALCSALGIRLHEVPIEPVHAAFRKALGELLESAPDSITDENIQARLRAVVLMAFVNRHGGMLLNTSNKTELTLGYGTLYGDLAGTLYVLGDLTKPRVYELARWYNAGKEAIPPFVLERPPSAELKPDQVDPFDYPRIAPIAEALVTGQPLPEDASDEEVERLDRLMRAAEHKRWQGGIVLKVTGRAFGSGRQVPVSRA